MPQLHHAVPLVIRQPPPSPPSPPPSQVAVESAGDAAGDAAAVEEKLLSLRKGSAKLRVRPVGGWAATSARRGRYLGQARQRRPAPRPAACIGVWRPPPARPFNPGCSTPTPRALLSSPSDGPSDGCRAPLQTCNPARPRRWCPTAACSAAISPSSTSPPSAPTPGRSWWARRAAACASTPTTPTAPSCRVRAWAAGRAAGWVSGSVGGTSVLQAGCPGGRRTASARPPATSRPRPLLTLTCPPGIVDIVTGMRPGEEKQAPLRFPSDGAHARCCALRGTLPQPHAAPPPARGLHARTARPHPAPASLEARPLPTRSRPALPPAWPPSRGVPAGAAARRGGQRDRQGHRAVCL